MTLMQASVLFEYMFLLVVMHLGSRLLRDELCVGAIKHRYRHEVDHWFWAISLYIYIYIRHFVCAFIHVLFDGNYCACTT